MPTWYVLYTWMCVCVELLLFILHKNVVGLDRVCSTQRLRGTIRNIRTMLLMIEVIYQSEEVIYQSVEVIYQSVEVIYQSVKVTSEESNDHQRSHIA